jgi:hypothetical protein
MRTLFAAGWLMFSAMSSANVAQAFDCRAVLNIPEETVSRESGSLQGEVGGLVRRLVQAGGTVSVARETKEVLQKYPLDSRSRHCSMMSYLACGLLEREDEASLAERFSYMQQILDICNQIALDALAVGAEIGPTQSDSRFQVSPIICKEADGQVTCLITLESIDRNRIVHLSNRETELVDDLGNPYDAQGFKIGSKPIKRGRYEFKANTATKLEVLFENINRSVSGAQNISIKFSNETDRDGLSIVFRNVTFE